jgi:hypothetical protein
VAEAFDECGGLLPRDHRRPAVDLAGVIDKGKRGATFSARPSLAPIPSRSSLVDHIAQKNSRLPRDSVNIGRVLPLRLLRTMLSQLAYSMLPATAAKLIGPGLICPDWAQDTGSFKMSGAAATWSAGSTAEEREASKRPGAATRTPFRRSVEPYRTKLHAHTLPDARFSAQCRGRTPGHAPARLAWTRRRARLGSPGSTNGIVGRGARDPGAARTLDLDRDVPGSASSMGTHTVALGPEGGAICRRDKPGARPRPPRPHDSKTTTGQVSVRVTPSASCILATTKRPSSSRSAASARAITS